MAAENVMAMTLRMRNTATRTMQDLRKQTDKTGVAAQKMGTKFGRAVKATKTSVGGLAGSFVSLKTIIIATFAYRAIQKFTRFLGSLTDYVNVQEEATLLLGQALAGWGNYSEEMVKRLRNQAEAMQSLINVDNEEIESMMGLLASYGMTGDEVSKVIGLTIDFAKAKRIELKAAVDLVGKAFIGYTGTLSRYGIILERGLTLEEKYAATLRELSVFTGTAETLVDSYGGKIGVLSKNYADMKKSMGLVIAAGFEQSTMFEELSSVVETVTIWFNKWDLVIAEKLSVSMGGLVEKVRELVIWLRDETTLAWGITFAGSMTIAVSAFNIWYRRVSLGLAYLAKLFIWFGKHVKSIWIYFKEGREAYEAYNREIKRFERETWAFIEKSSEQAAKKAEKDVQNIKDSYAAIKDAWEKAGTGRLLEDFTRGHDEMRRKLDAEAKSILDNVKNRKQYNKEMEETFKLSQNMARQFALATRLEQEQTKFLLQRLSSMTAEDIAGMSDLERKLISRQSVLKESYSRLFGEYAQKELGLEAEFLKEIKTTVEIDLTDEAKKLIKVSEVENERSRYRNVERLAG